MSKNENPISFFQGQINVNHRYASFDFCYLYFSECWKDCASEERMQTSCMVLWSYLSSWGMLRGSSFLLQKSPAYLKPLVEYISNNYQRLSAIDVDSYSNENIQALLGAYRDIANLLKCDSIEYNKSSSTLVTKIMLGVFGNIPAFDTFFCKTFSCEYPNVGFVSKTVNMKTLNSIKAFYDKHKLEIDTIAVPVIRFDGSISKVFYSKAKLIDMYGFQKGMELL